MRNRRDERFSLRPSNKPIGGSRGPLLFFQWRIASSQHLIAPLQMNERSPRRKRPAEWEPRRNLEHGLAQQ